MGHGQQGVRRWQKERFRTRKTGEQSTLQKGRQKGRSRFTEPARRFALRCRKKSRTNAQTKKRLIELGRRVNFCREAAGRESSAISLTRQARLAKAPR